MSYGVQVGSNVPARARTEKKNSKQKQNRSLLIRTVFLMTVCGVVAFALLAFRLYDIQVVNSAYYESRTLSAQLRETTISATRGSIYDANGKILAMSGPVENVFISPREIMEKEQDMRFIAENLAYILGVDFSDIMEKSTKTSSQYQIIKSKVNDLESEKIRAFISENRLSGIYLEPATKRYYPNGELASQILGFVGTDEHGLDGLEMKYNAYLSGVTGRDIRLTNAKGYDLMLSGYGDYYDARNGSNIVLTVNSSIQYYVEKHLAQAIIDYDVQKGAICIAINPKTGEILAIANYPTYDPNNFLELGGEQIERLAGIEDKEEYEEAYKNAQLLQWRNRALMDAYEPGSVFKIITLAMVLEENKANLDTIFECNGKIDVKLYDDVSTRNCWSRWGHGAQSLNSAIYNSCNVACVRMGLSVGARTFYKYVDAFGLFDKTGIEAAAEGRSIWWDESVFFDTGNETQLASASFGQTFKVTPIQMITAAAATVNGGYLMQPYLVKQITDSEGNIILANEPTMLRQVLSNETSLVMRSILEDVVSLGTGKNANVKGYRVGGKTGTSESIEQLAMLEENDTVNKDYIASFLGFAPADDPQIMILLLLDTPSHETGIYISGGNMAAPVVGKMLADILPMSLGILPEYTDGDFGDINVHMPRVVGQGIDEAGEILRQNGFTYTLIGEGAIVANQLPAPNTSIASGTNVFLYTDGDDAPRDTVTVPALYGMSYNQARTALAEQGLFIRTTGAPKTDGKSRVSVQSISAGREVMYGSVVEVTLIDSDASERRTN
ncbi:MAG: penicillin-binding transpeptidase domain-containing protein [Oscillospiraceae bacterium]|nr:penicillin-binding transpeptidase domain-containing protein [Oscillospiraceae bacterium]